MLADFVGTLKVLKERIQVHGDHIGRYEARTRVALIDPVLSALGWVVSDPGKVRVEKETGEDGRRVDYALLGDSGQPLVFVEAKRLSDKRPAVEQTAAYVFEENDRQKTNVRYCVWTNGDAWILWDITKLGTRTVDAKISGERPAKTALKLACLWRESLLDGYLEPVADLQEGERATPIDDAGRAPVGIQQTSTKRLPTGKLTEPARQALIDDVKERKLTQEAIGQKYGVSRSAVAYYVKNARNETTSG